MRRWALLLGFAACEASSRAPVEPVAVQPLEIEVVPAVVSTDVSRSVAEGSASRAPSSAPELPEWNDLRSRVVWTWVTDREAKTLRGATSLLASAPSARPPYSLGLAAAVQERRRATDDLTTLVGSPSFAKRRMVAPNLMGAVLLRREDAFVPVRVTLDPGSLLVDLDARSVRTLEGEGVPLADVVASAARVALFTARADGLRGYQLVHADRIVRLEIGTPEVLATFDRELELLEAFVQELAGAGPVEVPLSLQRLRRAAVEPHAGWDAKERIESLAALRAHARWTWSWEREHEPKLGHPGPGRFFGPANPCRRLFEPARQQPPGSECGTEMPARHYCSDGCSMVDDVCLPEASVFD